MRHIPGTAVVLFVALTFVPAFAQQTVTGPHGSSATGTVVQSGKTVTGTGSATGARGKSISGQGHVTATRTGATEAGSVTGPQGGTTSASGTTTKTASGATTTGTVTGPRGQSKSGTSAHAAPKG